MILEQIAESRRRFEASRGRPARYIVMDGESYLLMRQELVALDERWEPPAPLEVLVQGMRFVQGMRPVVIRAHGFAGFVLAEAPPDEAATWWSLGEPKK